MATTRNVRPPKFNDTTGAIRALAMDAVQKANSGHPGAPMGMAEIAEVLWNHHLRHNPSNPKWPDRDRFVQSNGHGSMLVYALLHLSGYDLPMEEIKRFRQMHSKTPGHPEYGYTVGVETTTGPLGQGITNAVGFAMAEKLLANEFNRPGHEIVNHHTYAFMGDGCMMEGISHEACALAGTWGLGKLIAFWDDNDISIDGHVGGWFTDNTPKRFEAYGWHVIADVEGHDPEAINAAINAAKAVTDKPSLICCKTIIGAGSPNKEGTHDVHGAALGDSPRPGRILAGTIRRLKFPRMSMKHGMLARVVPGWKNCGITSLRNTAKLFRQKPPSSSAAQRAICQPTGQNMPQKRLRRSTKKAKPSLPARLRKTRSMHWFLHYRNSSAVPPT